MVAAWIQATICNYSIPKAIFFTRLGCSSEKISDWEQVAHVQNVGLKEIIDSDDHACPVCGCEGVKQVGIDKECAFYSRKRILDGLALKIRRFLKLFLVEKVLGLPTKLENKQKKQKTLCTWSCYCLCISTRLVTRRGHRINTWAPGPYRFR